MKTIGIDVREFNKNKTTGISKLLNNLLLSLQAHKPDFELILFGNQNTVIPDSINLKLVKLPELFTLHFDQIQLPRAINKYNIDIFFTPYHKIPFFSKTNKILSIYDLTYLVVEPYKNQLNSFIYLKFLLKLFIKYSTLVLTISNNSKNDIVNFFNLHPDFVKVVYPGIDTAFTRRNERDITSFKQKHGINGRYILYVGNSMPHKNLGRLARAFELLRGG
jgi:glycosyltransferase involved in cell wall biosynthesis